MRRMIIAAMLLSSAMITPLAWGLSAKPWQIHELADMSELIIVGKVAASAKGTATVSVVETLKGVDLQTVDITGIQRWRSEPETLTKDKTYLLFLKKVDGKYEIVGSGRHLEGLRDPADKEEARKIIEKKQKL